MLRKEQNDILTQTGPGTSMGQMFRCYWNPVLLAEELRSRPAGERRQDEIAKRMPHRYGAAR